MPMPSRRLWWIGTCMRRTPKLSASIPFTSTMVRHYYRPSPMFLMAAALIILNNDLSEHMQRIVCAHELGHDQLHRELAQNSPLREFVIYDMKSKPEYEANIVASEILLDSDEVLDYIYNYHYTAEQIASAMYTDINLVALKIAHLATLGYNLRSVDYRSDFL